LGHQNATSGSLSAVPPQGGVPLLAAGVLSLILGGLFASQFGSPALAFEITALIISAIFIPLRWPYGALLVLVVASVMPDLSMRFGGWNARPEHFAVLMLCIALVFRWVIGKSSPIALTAVDYFVVAYVLWNYASSALMSADPKLTLRWALLNNLVVLPYFLIRVLVTDERMLRWFFRAFLVIGIAESAYAVAAFASRQLLGTSFGVDVDQYAAGLGGIYGTQYEPNLLGSYCACLAIMLAVLYFLSKRRSRWLVAGIVIALAAMLVSLSRAALIAFGFVLILMFFFGARVGLVRSKRLLPLGLGLAFFLTPIVVTGGKNMAARFANWSDEGVQGDVDTIGRVVEWSVAIENIWEHPIVGNGTASFQLLADARQLPILGDRPWVGNYLIRILNDTGVVGLFLFGLVTVAIGKQVRAKIAHGVRGREIIVALCAGCLVYAVAFLATDGTMLAFFWVHMGLLASACAVMGQHPGATIAPLSE
jgi:O-antigen ligase